MKRIVIVWAGFTGYTGACWQALAQLARIKIFIESSRYEQRFDGRDLSGLDWRRVSEIAESERVVEEIRAFDPELTIVCGWSTPLCRVVGKAEIPGRKVLAFDMPWEGTIRKILARFVLWPRLRRFDAAFVPGKRCAKYAKWLGFKSIEDGLNTSGWERFSEVRSLREGFLFAGRNSPEKGLDVLREAYEIYRASVEKPWNLDIVGGENFIRPEVMPRVMGEHKCLILPSKWEPWGIVVAEAMSAGLCTIVSEACGIVDDLRPTIKVRTGRARELAKAMVRVHAMSEKARLEEGRRARQAAERYSAANWVKRVMKI